MTERKLPTEFFIKTPEAEIPSIGVALLIVGFDPHEKGDNTNPLIWTIKELRNKPETDKIVGDVSIPAETKKVGESPLANILGALAEFGDDQSLEYLKNHLFLIHDMYTKKGIAIHGKPVDLTVLVYDGAFDMPFYPVSSEEVSPNGWMYRNIIQEMEGVRSVLKQVVELDRINRISTKAIEAYYKSPEKRVPVFPPGFGSIRDFHVQRELSSDVAVHVDVKS